MRCFVLAAVLAISAVPAFAQTEKEVSCQYQAQVVEAIQTARLDRVKERDVKRAVLGVDQGWPERFNAAIPLITPWVYELPMDQVRDNNLGEVWNEMCLQQ